MGSKFRRERRREPENNPYWTSADEIHAQCVREGGPLPESFKFVCLGTPKSGKKELICEYVFGSTDEMEKVDFCEFLMKKVTAPKETKL